MTQSLCKTTMSFELICYYPGPKPIFILATVRKDEWVFSLARKIWEGLPPSYQRKVEWNDLKLFKARHGFVSLAVKRLTPSRLKFQVNPILTCPRVLSNGFMGGKAFRTQWIFWKCFPMGLLRPYRISSFPTRRVYCIFPFHYIVLISSQFPR